MKFWKVLIALLFLTTTLQAQIEVLPILRTEKLTC